MSKTICLLFFPLLLLTCHPAAAQHQYRQWQLMFNMSGNGGLIKTRHCDMGDYLLYEYEFHEPMFAKDNPFPVGLKPPTIDSFIRPKGSAYSYRIRNRQLGKPLLADSMLEASQIDYPELEEMLNRWPDSTRQDTGHKRFMQIYTPDSGFIKKVYCYYDGRLMDWPFSICPALDKRHGSKLYKVEFIYDMRMPGEEMDSRSLLEITQLPMKGIKELMGLAAWAKKELAKGMTIEKATH